MSLDWLYGPRYAQPPGLAEEEPGFLWLRPLTIEIDDVVDVAHVAREYIIATGYTPDQITLVYETSGRNDPIPESEVIALGPLARSQISFHIWVTPSEDELHLPTPYDVRVTLSVDAGVINVQRYVQNAHDRQNEETLARLIADHLLSVGTPIPQWSLLRWTLPLIPALVMLIASIIGAITGWTIPTLVFALAATTGAALLGIREARRIYKLDSNHPRGMRIRNGNRQVRDEAAANHDVKVRIQIKTAVITGSIGLAFGFILALAIFAARIN